MSMPPKILKRRNANDDVKSYKKVKQILESSDEDENTLVVKEAQPIDNVCINPMMSRIENIFKELLDKISEQNKIIMEALAEQKVLVKMLIRQEKTTQSFANVFPINTKSALEDFEKTFLPECKDQYISILKSKINGNIKKNLKWILGDDIIKGFNVTGTHTKDPLIKFKNLYSILIDAIQIFHEDAERELRRAFQVHKKRIFKIKPEE